MSIAPWLSVADATAALDFYQRALGATAHQVLEAEGAVQVARLSLGGASFWLQQDGDLPVGYDPGRGVRMIVTVEDPDAAYAVALTAGGVEIAAVHDEHGWRTGRLVDPFGHQWELAREIC